MELEFPVMICLGGGDGGEVSVCVEVTDEEYELLIQCCREDAEIDGYDGLESLYDRIAEAARDEDECCSSDDEEEDTYYDDAYYMISFPDEICIAAESDTEEDEESESNEDCEDL